MRLGSKFARDYPAIPNLNRDTTTSEKEQTTRISAKMAIGLRSCAGIRLRE